MLYCASKLQGQHKITKYVRISQCITGGLSSNFFALRLEEKRNWSCGGVVAKECLLILILVYLNTFVGKNTVR